MGHVNFLGMNISLDIIAVIIFLIFIKSTQEVTSSYRPRLSLDLFTLVCNGLYLIHCSFNDSNIILLIIGLTTINSAFKMDKRIYTY